MESVEVKVPDIGEFTDVDVIEVMVKPGDRVGVDDPLIAIESEKATMEVPAPQAGVVKEIKVKLGDKVSEGSLILVLEAAEVGAASFASEAKTAPMAAAPDAPASPKSDANAPSEIRREDGGRRGCTWTIFAAGQSPRCGGGRRSARTGLDAHRRCQRRRRRRGLAR